MRKGYNHKKGCKCWFCHITLKTDKGLSDKSDKTDSQDKESLTVQTPEAPVSPVNQDSQVKPVEQPVNQTEPQAGLTDILASIRTEPEPEVKPDTGSEQTGQPGPTGGAEPEPQTGTEQPVPASGNPAVEGISSLTVSTIVNAPYALSNMYYNTDVFTLDEQERKEFEEEFRRLAKEFGWSFLNDKYSSLIVYIIGNGIVWGRKRSKLKTKKGGQDDKVDNGPGKSANDKSNNKDSDVETPAPVQRKPGTNAYGGNSPEGGSNSEE